AMVLREIDKLDKRGAEAVRATLTGEGYALAADVADRIMAFVQTRSATHADALAKLEALGQGGDTLRQGRDELRQVLELLKAYGVPEKNYALNFSIARGLDYYTGTVYETTLDEHPQIGSVCSGGRYDNLASSYTKSRLPGVGISIGATRLFWQLREAGIVSTAESSVQAMVGLVDESRLADSLDIARRLRAAGINAEVQLEAKKLAKQFQYADRAGIRFVLLYGDEEAAKGVVKVKDMKTQDQFELGRDELAAALKVELEQQRAMGTH
ncbi:MAG: histidine--tRNA ligase family protein, partial [Arenimonas sp.]|nr:histidine--tRNA ligase family protein [Arenimonas sp.]